MTYNPQFFALGAIFIEGEHVQVLTDHPYRLMLGAFLLLSLAIRSGAYISERRGRMDADKREDFNLILGATLTLLGLIIGFSFSMATGRYDQRKSLEEAEANAIGTAYARADLLPAGDGAHVKDLLRAYLRLRVEFYETTDGGRLKEIDGQTGIAQAKLWSAVVAPTTGQPNPLTTLVVSGTNDVLNSQGYTQAAWWNRIPAAAWALLLVVSCFGCLMIGYGARAAQREAILLLVLPAIVSISLFLIADIDCPRGGLIRVVPQNLLALEVSLE